MTIGEWLATRTPAPPAELDAALRAALGDAVGRDAAAMHDEALAAAERLLSPLLARGCETRAQANILLTADALVTYAFEAAADEPEVIAERATAAMMRLAQLAARTGRGAEPGAGGARGAGGAAR